MGSATVCSAPVLFNAFINTPDKGMQHMFGTSANNRKAGCNCNSVGGQD